MPSRVAVLTLMLAAACAACVCPPRIGVLHPKVYGYDIDAAFTDPEVRELREGVRAWEEALGGHLVMVETVPRKADIHFKHYGYGELGFLNNGHVIVGEWHESTGEISIIPNMRTRATVIHEIGHMWRVYTNDVGIKGHNDDPTSDTFMRSDVMKVTHPYGKIPPEDVVEACRVIGC